MKIIIPGEPISQQRGRYVQRNGKVIVFNPQDKQKEQVRNQIRLNMISLMLHENAEVSQEAHNLTKGEFYDVSLTFYMSVPVSDSYVARNAKLWHLTTCVKDLDNMEKFYLDAANEILYPDDHLITSLQSHKLYDIYPRTEFTVIKKVLPTFTEPEKSVVGAMSPDALTGMVIDMSKFYHLVRNLDMTETPIIEKLRIFAPELVEFAIRYADDLKKLKTKSLK